MIKKKKINHKKKINIFNLLDILCIPIYIIITCILCYLMHSYSMKLTILIGVILFLLLCFYFYTLRGESFFVQCLRKLYIISLCGCMLFGISKINTFNSFFDSLSETSYSDEFSTTLVLYSLASNDYYDAKITSLNDLDGCSIGMQVNTDYDASIHIQEQLNEDYDNLVFDEYNSYSSILSQLYLGYIDCALINIDLIDNYSDSYDFDTDFIYLNEYTYTTTLDASAVDKDISSEVFSVLISGSDEAGNYSKTDMNMLLVVDPTCNQITAISIPRDSYVANPAYNNTSDKLTHTGANGIENTVQAIENTFEIDIDFYIKVSFTSIITIVDTIGGIEVDVPITFCEQDENRSFDEEDLVCITSGVQTLDGQEALAYARHRDSYVDQDLGRNQAQLSIVKAMVEAVLTPTGLTTTMDELLSVIPDYVITNFTTTDIKLFIKSQIDNLQSWTFESVSLTSGIAGSDYTASSPYTTSSVYYLSLTDILKVNSLFSEPIEYTFYQFTFDIDTLYEKETTYHNYYNIVIY